MSGAAYPVMLDLAHLPALVVGGGPVAARKVAGLVRAGGRPVIVSPEVVSELLDAIHRHSLVWHARTYEEGEAASYRLVFAATNDPGINEFVAADARSGGALWTRADDADDSAFQVPAHIRRDDVVVALATGGASPLLARRVRERLEAVVTPGLGRAASRLAGVRKEVQARWPADEGRRRAFWFELITPEFLDLAVAGRDEDVEQAIRRCLSQS